MFVLQPTSVAYRPVWKMGMIFLALLIVTAALAMGVSLFIAARISQPIVALTHFTRRFAREGASPDPPPPGPGEVGELTHAYIQLIHDLDESRAQLIRAAKLAVAGEMAAAMTHEIRTPLGILRSSAQMLQREPQLSAEGREMTGFVVSETDRLNQLVSSLLSFARPSPPVFATHDLHLILQRTMTMLTPQAERKHVRFVPAFQDSPAILTCDEEQMIQVFLNLFINAFQALAAGGEVVVRTHTEDHLLLVEVADNGPGIPLALRHKVFEPFFTTRENGIGLGLTVVQQIVHGHGGTIAITENSTGGACFCIQFPQERSVEQ
jgi:signal transduction histidine kinase